MSLRFCLVPLALVACSSANFSVADTSVADISGDTFAADADAVADAATDSPAGDAEAGVFDGTGIWVKSGATASGANGSWANPYPTFTAALAAGAQKILGCAGTYDESVTITESNVSIFGAIDCSQSTPGNSFVTGGYSNIVQVGSFSEPAVVIRGASNVRLWYLQVTAPNSIYPGVSAIAMFVANTTGLELHHCDVQAGNGGPGSAPAQPAKVASGVAGDGAITCTGLTTSATLSCTTGDGDGGGKGNAQGGAGGEGSAILALSPANCGMLKAAGSNATTFIAGTCGLGVAYAGVATTPGAPQPSTVNNGCPGVVGNPVSATPANTIGTFLVASNYNYSASNAGQGGSPGGVGGGGGGGAAYGSAAGASATCFTGDGGGGGGAGGAAGAGGGGGGASLALVLYNSPGASIEFTTFKVGTGGMGGAGGKGGVGGDGGPSGGSPNDNTGLGGQGGPGGAGSCGAGGGGGPAINIAYDAVSAPTLATTVNFVDGIAGANGPDCNGNAATASGVQKETYVIPTPPTPDGGVAVPLGAE
jgi:hypothetical protein